MNRKIYECQASTALMKILLRQIKDSEINNTENYSADLIQINFLVKLPAIAVMFRYCAGSVQERRNTCTMQVYLHAI